MVRRLPRLTAAAGSLLVGFFLVVPISSGASLADGEIQDILDDLQGLPFDEFVDASYKQVLLRSPQLVTSLGLSQTLGIRDDQLDDVCYSFIDETFELEAGIHAILNTYDREDLSYEQQISYDSYSWILDGWAVEHEYMYHFYPVTHGFSRQNDLFRFFEDEHPMETLRNARDYIRRLRLVDDQFDCLIRNLEESEPGASSRRRRCSSARPARSGKSSLEPRPTCLFTPPSRPRSRRSPS